MNVFGQVEDITLKKFEILRTCKSLEGQTRESMKTAIEAFFILAQAVINKDIMRYPYWIPVSVLDIVKVNKSKAYLSKEFGLISAEIQGNSEI